MLTRRVPAGVWALVAVALALRLAAVGLTFHTPTTLDPADFSRTAASIAQGHGYPPSNRAPGGGPSAFRPPAYPVFLAGVYLVAGGKDPGIGRLAGALLGTLAVALIGLIALRLWGRRVAMMALGIAAVAPPLVILSTALISEALFVPVVLAAVLAAIEGRRRNRPIRWAILTGVLAGVAALTRTNGILLVLPLSLAFAPERSRLHPRHWGAAGVVVIATLITVAPWVVRDWTVFHAFVPISDESGYTLAGTYNQVSRAERQWPAEWIEAEHGASPEYGQILFEGSMQRWNEVVYGDHLQAAAIADIEQDPWYVAKVAYWNTVRMFHLGELDLAINNLRDTDVPRIPALLEIFGFYPLAALALGGLATRRARSVPRWLWLLLACLFTPVLITGFIRFRSPIDPFFVMLAALALTALAERRERAQGRRRRIGFPTFTRPVLGR